LDYFSPHLSAKKDAREGDWAEANNVELAYVSTNTPLAEPDRGAVPGVALRKRCLMGHYLAVAY
jgi:hypothetical protein